MTNKKIFYFIIFSLIIITFTCLPIGIAFAASNATTDFKNAVISTFKWGLGIAGLIAGISFAVGAVQYVVSDHAGGKDRMIGSVVGMVILFGSWIIMQEVNPKLTLLEFTPLPAGPGIYLAKGGEKQTAPRELADTTDIVNQGYNKIVYNCIGPANKNEHLLIWSYDRPGYTDADGNQNARKTYDVSCGQPSNLNAGGSYKMAIETPGVYFYSQQGCDGEASTTRTTEQSPVTENFAIKSYKIVTGFSNDDPGIGVVIHNNMDTEVGGFCERMAHISTEKEKCFNTDISVGSVSIFYVPSNAKTGTGVNFYSESTGWNTEENAGVVAIPANNINRTNGFWSPANTLVFNYAKTNRNSDYQKLYKTFKDKQGSIQINGNYLVGLFSKAENDDKYWCQTFKKDVVDLGQQNALAPNFLKDPENSYLGIEIYQAEQQ